MKKSFLFLFELLLVSTLHINYAQTTMHSYYDFSVSSSSYSELTSPTVLVESGGDDFYLVNGGTAPTGVGYPIGFNFYFNGEYFTRFGISSNGYIGLGTEADGVNLTASYNNPISSNETISPSRLRNKIVAFGKDITHYGSSSTPAISYATLGTSPNRILVIQFKGWRRYGTDYSSDIINFQIRLHETSNTVEIIYGSCTAAPTTYDPYHPQVGLAGKNTSEYFNLTTTNNWSSPSSGSTADARMFFGNGIAPTTGTKYTWTLRTQSYVSSTTEQASTNFVLKGQTNQQIIRLKITTSGWIFPFSVTSITFTTNGTTTTSNITAARVYYTNSDAFSTTTQFGSQINNPSGTLTFNGSQVLGQNQTHSFWLVYDISSSASTSSQYVDGTCTSFTTNESGNPTRSPAVTDPTGNRQILGALSGTVTVGEGGDYPTLTGTTISTGLFTAINSLGLSGNLTVNIISDITETGFTALNQWTESGGSGYTVTIQPSSASLKTISGSTSSYVIKLNGADRVTINGNYSGSGQYLKISNTYTGYCIGTLQIDNGAANNNFKNCIIEGGGGQVIWHGTSSALNQNNLFENCDIKNYSSSNLPQIGINFYSPNNSSAYNNLNTIRNCRIYNFSNTGLSVSGGANTIENCEIYRGIGDGFKGISFTVPTSITSTESNIRNNKIYDLHYSGGNVTGINIYAYGGIINVYNNSISFETNTTGQVNGISLSSDASYTSTLNLYFNSIYIRGSIGSSGYLSAGIYKSSAINTLRIKNNSIFNARTTTSGTLKNYAIYFANTSATTSDYNYNDYYVNGTNSYIGYWSADKSTLADWQSASGKDANSISSNPQYISSSNLKPFNTSPLINAGTPITGITTDIDGTARNGSTPYIGAYESNQIPVTVDFCNIQTGNQTIKEGQTATFYARIEKSGVTTGAGQGAGIECWIGYSTSNTDPSTWTNWTQATYVGDAGDRDEYSVTFPASLTPNTYYIASRVFITNANGYQYGGYSTDGGGTWNGTTNNSSLLTVQDNAIDFANISSSPVSVKLGVNKIFYANYGLPDVTTQSSQNSAVQAWIGYNSSNTNPSTWAEGNWVAATFVEKSDNYHKYKASFGSSLNIGTYYYASRFKLNNDSYVYGGYSSEGGGIYNGTTNLNGTINVNAELPLFENFDNNVTPPALPNGWTKTSSSPTWSTLANNYNSSPNAIACAVPGTLGQSADAWLFSPPLSLTEGVNYKIVFYAKHNNLYQPKIKGRFGSSATAGGMTSANVFDISLTSSYARYSYTFTPSSSGTFYFGWHHYSMYWNGYYGNVFLDNIEIYENPANTSSQTIPASNTTQYSFGSTGVTIQFTTGNGQNLTINVDQVNSSPGTNGELPSGINKIIPKYWNIALASGSITTGVYTISFDVTGIQGVNEPKDLYLLKRSNSNSEWQNLGKPAYSEDNICYWNNLTSFSEFTLGGDEINPLPVELQSFAASVQNRNVTLTWQTTTEINNHGFEIERCVGQTSVSQWQKIGFIQGEGNSNSIKSYLFIDEKLQSGKYLYRLKIIDTDGSFTYSNEVEADVGLPNEFYLSQNYPNPFNPTTKIDYQIPFASDVKIELYSILGERIAVLVNQRQEAGYYTTEIDANSLRLSSGVYFYRLESKNVSKIKKLILLR